VTLRNAFAGALMLAALAALPACDKLGGARSPFQGVDVTGSDIAREFHLQDAAGKPRSLADFRGKVVVMTFGYTHCPDVCPLTLANLASAKKKLGEDGKDVQVLFVTVDPTRDKPEILREYVPAFDPTFIGLTGTPDQVTAVTKEFRVYAATREGKPGEEYTVDHSAQMFAFDKAGKIRLVFAPDMKSDAIASDLRILLNS
jgi:protein SCO1/2